MPTWLQPHLDAHGGTLRFDRFMELALYHPARGYYGARISTLGPRADFSTTPTLSPTLGVALARWIAARRPRNVIEIGAGNGALAASIRKQLPFRVRRRLTYRIVERSPGLEATQRSLLGRAATWHPHIDDALAASGGAALVFSNELVDAFPVRVFRRRDGGESPSDPAAWEELFLSLRGDELGEVWHPPAALPDSTHFTRPWPPGQRLEVAESYRQWLGAWLPHWRSGDLLTIDYGGSPAEIYHRRPAGTLRAYTRHQRLEGTDVYRSPGRRDLTADVNFDDLRHWGTTLGLTTLQSLTQREFLAPHASPRGPDPFLLDPHGAGSAFKVLLQRRQPAGNS